MLFIERPYGYVNYKKTFLLQSNNTYDSGTETKSTSYWGYTESFRLLNDNNTVYEFHYYEPDTLTSNGLSYKPEEPDYTYSDTIAIKNGSADASVEFLDEVKNVNVAIRHLLQLKVMLKFKKMIRETLEHQHSIIIIQILKNHLWLWDIIIHLEV